jgi:transposase
MKKATNPKEPQRRIIVGMDLHSNNVMCGVINESGQRLKHKRITCDLGKIQTWLDTYNERIETIIVESTYNWYWLVDGLKAAGYEVVLANPAGLEQYQGIKYTDDKSDAFWLAELWRLGVLPQGHIYEAKSRPVRDLLRRRLGLVRHRTALWLSLQSLCVRTHGYKLEQKADQSLSKESLAELFSHECDQLIAQEQARLVGEMTHVISQIEKKVVEQVKGMPYYYILRSIPGIGKILGLTITLETGPAERFKGAGQYASYSRCVATQRISNGKKKGRNNSKCGNKYLAWAWMEAAQFARRYDQWCRRYYDRKSAQTNVMVASKALACKLCKAAWHMMKENREFDARRVFPQIAMKAKS